MIHCLRKQAPERKNVPYSLCRAALRSFRFCGLHGNRTIPWASCGQWSIQAVSGGCKSASAQIQWAGWLPPPMVRLWLIGWRGGDQLTLTWSPSFGIRVAASSNEIFKEAYSSKSATLWIASPCLSRKCWAQSCLENLASGLGAQWWATGSFVAGWQVTIAVFLSNAASFVKHQMTLFG